MGLKIDLDDIGGEDFQREIAAATPHPLDEVMSRALESSNGIEVEFTTREEAEAMRFRMYRRIKALRKHGIKSYDLLVIGLKGSTLRMSRLPSFNIKDL
jgi:hypothetical protein